MGHATVQARAASVAALDAVQPTLQLADELFAVSRTVAESSALASALGDATTPAAAREALVERAFASLSNDARSVVAATVAERWSHSDDLITGLESLAIRAAVAGEHADVEHELFTVADVISHTPELELALGSRIGGAEAKVTLVRRILGDAASDGTTLIVTSLIQNARGRRVRQLLKAATELAAAQRGRAVATVVTAAPLSDAQRDRLAASLSRTYAREITVNSVVDKNLIGGIRVQIADDVIDASVTTRLTDLRQRLAG